MNRFRVTISGAALLAALAGATALAGCGGDAATGQASGPQASSAAMSNPNLDIGTSLGGEPAPDFRLVNQFGRPMSLSQFRGKVVMLGFEDSQCTNVCPLTTQSMVLAKQLLGPAGDQVKLLGVDANPDATSVANVLSYTRTHGMVNQWDFLTGSMPQLKAIWKSYHIAVQVERGQIDHTPALFVIDSKGREQKIYLTQMAYSSVTQSAKVLADEISTLLPGHPRVASQQSLATVAVQGPKTRLTLPSAQAQGGTVALGPGQPRLVMFFATWLSEVDNLKSELLTGNAYQAAARRGGLPQLVAVDETSVEPSAQAVRD
jgi:cytochrome oxidase Cu insertion factor (SCO1/SenC/PrrC family)